MKRILHVTTSHEVSDVRIAERECRSLARVDGWRVAIAGRGRVPDQAGIRHLPLSPGPRHRLLRLLAANPRAVAALRRTKADVYHFHDPELLPLALVLAKLGRAVIWDSHEDYLEEVRSGKKDWIPIPLRKGVLRVATATLNEIDKSAVAIVAATSTIATGYRNPRTTVVGNEVRPEEFQACRPKFEARQLLFTGTTGELGLFPVIVAALELLPDVRLIAAGKGRDEPASRDARRQLGNRFQHVGWQERPQLAELITSSSLGLVTYADWPTNEKNSPNKLYEFTAGGLPVIATPNLRISEIVRGHGLGVVAEGFSVEDVARAIRHGLDNASTWQQWSHNARAFASSPQGNWSASEERLVSMYRSVLNET